MLIQASARALPIADETVQCVVTSPPYWGLRQYAGEQREVWGGEPGHAHEWGGRVAARPAGAAYGWTNGKTSERDAETIAAFKGQSDSGSFCPCGAWYGALGLEPTPDLYVQHIVEVFREVRRVLRKDGTLWLNLGDSYAANRGNGASSVGEKQATNVGALLGALTVPDGLKPKDLVGIPWMVAFALRADGWYLRSDIIWHKPNPMPESVTDRPTKSHEYLFLLTKSERYYYDHAAIKEPLAETNAQRTTDNYDTTGRGPRDGGNGGLDDLAARMRSGVYTGRNKRDVWTIPTSPYAEAHFATYPEALVEPCILAGSAAKACGVCGAPWERITERGELEPLRGNSTAGPKAATGDPMGRMAAGYAESGWTPGIRHSQTVGWQPTCAHDDGTAASRVLDPFNGSGTTGAVALRLGREYVGTDLSAEYLAMAERRIGAVTPVATTVAHAARVAGTRGAQLSMGALDAS